MTISLSSWQLGYPNGLRRPAPEGGIRWSPSGPPKSELDVYDNIPAGLHSTWWDGHKRIGDEDFIVDFERFAYRRMLMEAISKNDVDFLLAEMNRAIMNVEELKRLTWGIFREKLNQSMT